MSRAHAEHHARHETASENALERLRGKLTNERLVVLVNALTPEILKHIADMLTGKPDGTIDMNHMHVKTFLYYAALLLNEDLEQALKRFNDGNTAVKQACALTVTGNQNGTIDLNNPAHVRALIAFFGLDGSGITKKILNGLYTEKFDDSVKKTLIAVTAPGAEAIVTRVKELAQNPSPAAITALQIDIGKIEKIALDMGINAPATLVSIKQILIALDDLQSALTLAERERGEIAVEKNEIERQTETARRERTSATASLGKAEGDGNNTQISYFTGEIGRIDAQISDLQKKLDVLKTKLDRADTEFKSGRTARDLKARELKTIDVTALFKEYTDFLEKIEQKRKAFDLRIKKPQFGTSLTFLAIQQELTIAGLTGADLIERTAENFAQIAVGMTAQTFGGLPAYSADAPLAEKYTRDAGVIAAAPGEIGRKSAKALLKDFPIFNGLNVSSSKEDIALRLEKITPEQIAKLIAVLRYEALSGRDTSVLKGVKLHDLTPLEAFVRALEDILVLRIEKAVMEGNTDPATAFVRAHAPVNKILFVPLAHAEHDPKIVKKDLQHLCPPEKKLEEAEHGITAKRVATVAAMAGAVFAGIDHVVGFLRGKKPNEAKK